MKRGWVITTGCYSDYSIVCICATEEVANELVAKAKKDKKYIDWEVEEFDLLESSDEYATINYYRVQIDKEGNILQQYSYVIGGWAELSPHKPWPVPGAVAHYTSTKSIEHAAQAAREEWFASVERDKNLNE